MTFKCFWTNCKTIKEGTKNGKLVSCVHRKFTHLWAGIHARDHASHLLPAWRTGARCVGLAWKVDWSGGDSGYRAKPLLSLKCYKCILGTFQFGTPIPVHLHAGCNFEMHPCSLLFQQNTRVWCSEKEMQIYLLLTITRKLKIFSGTWIICVRFVRADVNVAKQFVLLVCGDILPDNPKAQQI